MSTYPDGATPALLGNPIVVAVKMPRNRCRCQCVLIEVPRPGTRL